MCLLNCPHWHWSGAKLGLSGYQKMSRQIRHLSLAQVSNLMADSIAKVNRLTVQQANDLLGHRAMRVQLNLLMGLPGFMDMALGVLHASLKTGLPQNDQEFRSAAFAIGK
jgi:ABC-type transporter lipoprotein component MlaA